MLEKFSQYIEEEQLLQASDRILIAVSAGVDSVVLCHLLKLTGFEFGIAHCNFKLRDDDSEKDAAFVKALANQLAVPYFETTFDTLKIVAEKKSSIQIVARDLRYDWLEKIRTENNFQYIATAHHLNDSLESILYNFTKGCGIRGLHGIPSKRDHIIRPLLFASKEDIHSFAAKNDIVYREDRSNATDKYNRNKIRHHVIPVLKAINPNLEYTVKENIERLQEVESLYNYAVESIKSEITRIEAPYDLLIDFDKLSKLNAASTILYELIDPFGFNGTQVKQILQTKHLSGAQFFSSSHRLLINRGRLLIEKKQDHATDHFLIFEKDESVQVNQLLVKLSQVSELPEQFTNELIAYFDYDQIQFPLKLRRWEKGDRFQPLGMPGRHQKISDFFNNHKFSIFQKERTWLLESAGKICWIVGHRLDDRFKILPTSKRYLKVEVVESGS